MGISSNSQLLLWLKSLIPNPGDQLLKCEFYNWRSNCGRKCTAIKQYETLNQNDILQYLI